MQVQSVHHSAAEALAHPQILALAHEVEAVLRGLPVPIWEGKSEKQVGLSILQPMLNALVYESLVPRGWAAEVALTHDGGSAAMTVDFVQWVDGRLVALEVQFGNAARLHSDFMKFIYLRDEARLALAMTVTFERQTATLADSGVANFGQVTRGLETFARSLRALPMVCLGISHHNSALADFSKSQFPSPTILSGVGAKTRIHTAARALLAGTPIEQIGADSTWRGIPVSRPAGPQHILF